MVIKQKKGGGCTINNKIVEIKTSCQGTNGSFQHELGPAPEHPEFYVLMDIEGEGTVWVVIYKIQRDFIRNRRRWI